jgi:tRNA pseudouridine13 synthase
MYGAEKPVVGDLVFETESDDQDLDAECESEEVEPGTVPFHSQPMHKRIPSESMTSSEQRSRKPWSAPRIKTLTEEDLENYSIFDVIMPLPGTDVAYPGGMLGEKYCEFLRADGLDPDNFTRKQRLVAFDVHLVPLN